MCNQEEIPELLSLKSVCRKLDLHSNTLRNWEKKGLLRVYTIGIKGNRRYRKDDLIRLLTPRYYEGRIKLHQESERLKQIEKSLNEWREKAGLY